MLKVSVIITAYNYGRYLRRAIESVLSQRFEDYEVIVVDDCSNDDTPEVLEEFIAHPRLKIITHSENQGFIRSCHEAIELSRGEYIIRLDADDYLDENALLVLSNLLDTDRELGLVYSDYFTVSAEGRIIDYVRLPGMNSEVKLRDIPPNGATMMFRRSCYAAVGGYDLSLACQDGYDLWSKFRHRFRVQNVNLPLFYYRRHGANFGEDSERLLSARRYIKKRQVADEKIPKPRVLGLVPAGANDCCAHLALRQLGNKPLIAYTINEALSTPVLDRVVLITEDEGVAAVARQYGVEIKLLPSGLARRELQHMVLYMLEQLADEGFSADIVAVLSPNSPFRKADHITEAVNTMMLFPVDSVVSVCQDNNYHYRHGPCGLVPLFKKNHLRREEEALYEENGAVYASRVTAIDEDGFLGNRIGHIVMTREASVYVGSEFDFGMVRGLVNDEIGFAGVHCYQART